MGYTHYWKTEKQILFSDEEWETLKNVSRQLVEECVIRGIKLTSDCETTPPIINDEVIVINGNEDNCCETFVLERYMNDFYFCKTRYKNYDIIVVALLIYISNMKYELNVSSDGDYEDWKNGLELLETVLGRKFEMPIINYNDR